MRRVRFLPEVFAARGTARLPRGQRRRPRAMWSLLALGVFVLATAGALLAAIAYGAAAVWPAIHGPRDQIAPAVLASAVGGVVATAGPRGRTWLVRRWMAREYGDDNPAGRPGG